MLILPSDMKYFLSLVCVFATQYLQLHYVGLLIPQLSAYSNSNSFAICFFLWESLNCMKLALMSCLPCFISSLCLSCLEKNGHKKTSGIGKLLFLFFFWSETRAKGASTKRFQLFSSSQYCFPCCAVDLQFWYISIVSKIHIFH